LLRQIETDALVTAAYTGRDTFDPRVMAALGRVPRHEFVPPSETAYAYYNNALPIGHGQTISQPYIVALMTDLLDLGDSATVLEVGTGSGYQAAVLAELARQVYSIEIVRPLADQAAERLARLGYSNVAIRSGDGYGGWPEHAPYDGIIVTAAAEAIPPPLIDQLKPGARLVIPVARGPLTQDLVLVEKSKKGKIHQRVVLPVAFVPLTGRHGDDATDSS
jgi:protein-L-isoaspartate(D-aspartate) O-methyltransferase